MIVAGTEQIDLRTVLVRGTSECRWCGDVLPQTQRFTAAEGRPDFTQRDVDLCTASVAKTPGPRCCARRRCEAAERRDLEAHGRIDEATR